MPDTRQANSAALRKAGEYVRLFLKAASPSAESAAAWTISVRGNVIHFRNRHLGAWATALNKRHPFWGHWEASPKVATNWAKPERTNWDARGLEAAGTEAVRIYGDNWIQEVARNSDLWEAK